LYTSPNSVKKDVKLKVVEIGKPCSTIEGGRNPHKILIQKPKPHRSL
jgi:hypothetical protein